MRIVSGFHYASFSSQLRVLNKAILAELKKMKLNTLLQNNTDFTGILYNLSKKYIHNRFSDDDKYDILVSAFKYVFLEAGKKDTEGALKNFTGEYKGEFITIEQYIASILKNAIINENKKALNEMSFDNRQDVSQLEGESYEDALSRMMSSPKTRQIFREDDFDEQIVIFEQYVKDVKDLLDTRDYSEKTKKGLEKKLKKFLEKIYELEEERDKKEKYIYLELDEAVNDFTPDEEKFFNQLVKTIEKKLSKTLKGVDKDRAITYLALAIDGKSLPEIREALGLKSSLFFWLKNKIGKVITDYAEELALFDDDNTLLKSLNKYFV